MLEVLFPLNSRRDSLFKNASKTKASRVEDSIMQWLCWLLSLSVLPDTSSSDEQCKRYACFLLTSIARFFQASYSFSYVKWLCYFLRSCSSYGVDSVMCVLL